MIPYGRQSITEQDIEAVVEVLRSDFLTQGPAVPAFEKAISEHTGSRFVVAVNSATSALHIACLSLGVGPGDIVWTTPITFVASANCALYCGAEIDFVDIDPVTYNMCPSFLADKLKEAKKLGKLPKVVIPVHLCGQPCDMAAIHSLSLEYGFRIIEDASHAIGGKYRGEPIGNCRYSDVCIFSFHPVKIITTAEGGVAITNDAQVASKLELLRSHGITRDPQKMTHPPDGPWYYQQIALGFNYRMTDIQAALGLSQIQRLDQLVRVRHTIAKRYDALLAHLPLTLPWQHPDGYSALHLYVIRLQGDKTQKTQVSVFEMLREHGIGVNLHYIPVVMQPFYQSLGFNPQDYPAALKYYSDAMTLPIYPDLTIEMQTQVVKALERALL